MTAPLRHAARDILLRLAPRLGTAVLAARSRRQAHRAVRTWDVPRLNALLAARFGLSVQEGPFAGLQLPRAALAEHLGPVLLGVYESELDGVWHDVLARDYPQILDVGCRIGYYAVGLARRYPAAAVVGFDPDWWSRRATRAAARANGARNVAALAWCDPVWLRAHLRNGALIVSDCEGYENRLFAERDIPALRTATLIIETHDELAAGVTERLAAAFAASHAVRVVEGGAARRSRARDLSFLDEGQRQLAQHEVRGASRWLCCTPAAA